MKAYKIITMYDVFIVYVSNEQTTTENSNHVVK